MKKKILVVDEDFELLQQLRDTLEGAGYEVTTAEGRLAAEDALLSVKPDLTITELMLEEKDSGFILGHEIHQLYPGTPIILLTGVTGATGLSFTTQNAEARSWIPADTIIDKPARSEQLLAEMRRLLGEPAVAAGDIVHAHR